MLSDQKERFGIHIAYKNDRTFINHRDLLEWCEENNLSILYVKLRHSESTFGPSVVVGATFYFTDESDATAFKLKWI